ncbi:hypothetical protein HYR54_03530 [Candidatus Acetothermia bacterium]|nr:hypothetical protein [Candidatus Acetothermia bacterium]
MIRFTRFIAVVGVAFMAGLLAVGIQAWTQEQITPEKILVAVGQLQPLVKVYRPGNLGFPRDHHFINRFCLQSFDTQNWLDCALLPVGGSYLPAMLAAPRDGVLLFKHLPVCEVDPSGKSDCGALVLSLFLGRREGVMPLGAIELVPIGHYKFGNGFLSKGRYNITALYDPENKLDAAVDPDNKINFFLALVSVQGGESRPEVTGLIGLSQSELARVLSAILGPGVPVQEQGEFGVIVLLNLVSALIQL